MRVCGLCNEPKFVMHGISLCKHCDTTVNCRGSLCGACKLARERTTYDGLVWGDNPTLPDAT